MGFLTNPAAGLGKHAKDPANPGKCFCSFIYGKLPPESYINILHAPRSENEQAEHEEKRRFAEADAQAMGQILVDEHDYRDPYAFYEAQRLALLIAFQRCCDNGHTAPWGCQWFETWLQNIELAVQQGHTLIVFYFEGKVGNGELGWLELANAEAVKLAKKNTGLGASQTVEVAYLEHNGYAFVRRDISDFEARTFFENIVSV